jgi:hypothetical protein
MLKIRSLKNQTELYIDDIFLTIYSLHYSKYFIHYSKS